MDLPEAYRQCEQITWTQARNFAYGIRLLPPPKRRGLAVIYAFARRIDDIGDGTLPAEHPYKPVRVQPEVASAPELWLLGSSDYSGALAAQLGLPFSFAHFINPRGGEEVTRAYRRHFQAGRESAPRVVAADDRRLVEDREAHAEIGVRALI